jgi:transcriptional regulator with XRE-family HTH domain
MSDLGTQLGRRIYSFRKQNKLTQAALAEKAKISNEFVSAVERGAKLPSIEVLDRIATALKVEIKDVFNFDRSSFRRLEPMSREVLDLASMLQALPADRRRKALKLLRIASQ